MDTTIRTGDYFMLHGFMYICRGTENNKIWYLLNSEVLHLVPANPEWCHKLFSKEDFKRNLLDDIQKEISKLNENNSESFSYWFKFRELIQNF